MSFDQARFGDTIRLLRRNLGMTQQDLGDTIGVTNAAIGQFESAKTTPGVVTVAALADALGVSVGVLFGDRLALAEHAVAQCRAEVRALGYDLALIPKDDA